MSKIIYMDSTIELFKDNNRTIKVNKNNVELIEKDGYTIIETKNGHS